jgi:adenylate cyclase
MNAETRQFTDWALPLAILAVAVAFIIVDPAHLAMRLANFELDAWQANLTTGATPRAPAFLMTQSAFLAPAGAALTLLLARGRLLWAAVFTVMAIAVMQGASWITYASGRQLFDTANASAALLLAAGAGYCAFAIAGRREVAIEPLTFSTGEGGEREGETSSVPRESRAMTTLACGLRGVSQLAESYAGDAADFARLLNSVMAPLVDDAVRHGAVIGHFDGTSFSAHWTAPLEGTGHAQEACEAAGRMILSLAGANEMLAHALRRDGRAFEMAEIGIGLATGPASIVPLRSRARAGTCVIGANAEMAERIRHLSWRYGPAIIASETTRDISESTYAFLEVDFLAPQPGDTPIRVYALLGNAVMRASPKFRAVAAFHEHIFRAVHDRQWEKARSLIEQCRRLSGASQKIYDLHLARIAWFEANPPDADWDGAFRVRL